MQVVFRRGDGFQVIFLLQHLHHPRREEGGQGGPQPDVFDAQRQQRDQDAHGLLLKPAQHQRERQVVHPAAKGVCQRQCDADGTVGVVALAHVQNAGQPGAGHVAQRQIVQPELAARQRQDHRVLWGELGELGVVPAGRPCAVAAAHQEKVPDLAVLYRLHDLARMAQHGIVRKAGDDGLAAVHAGHEGVLFVAAQLQRPADDGGEIPPFVDVHDAGVGHHRGGEHPVGVTLPQGHDAVGGEQDGRGDILKLGLLVLPCGAEVALQVGVFLLQLRVAVGGQHLRVGVDVDALALRLLEQLLHVEQVMAGNHDERPFFNGQRHFHRHRVAKGPGVGGVQQLHAAVAGFAGLLHQRPQLVHGKALGAQSFQRGAEKAVQLRVDAAQHPGVVVVGRHAPQAEQHEAFQAAHVRVRLVPQPLHVVVRRDGRAGGVDLLGEGVHGGGVKVDIGDGGEQPLHQQKGLLRGRGAARVHQLPGIGDQRAGEPVLRGGCLGRFAAHTRCPGAGRAARRLLTLKTEHPFVHRKTPFPA